MSLKSKLDDLIEELLDETNSTGEGEAYDTPNAFGELEDEDIEKSGYKKVKESTFKKAAKLMIGEGSYKSYKNDESFTPKQKVNKAIKSINSKLYQEDTNALKALIRKEVSKIFFDLYRKRSTWSK